MTSSAFSINTVVPSSSFAVTAGTPRTYTVTSDSGNKNTLHFCGDCGSALWIDGRLALEGMKIVKSGVMDVEGALDGEGVRPVMEQYVARRPGWVCMVEGAVQVKGQQGSEETEANLKELKAQKVA